MPINASNFTNEWITRFATNKTLCLRPIAPRTKALPLQPADTLDPDKSGVFIPNQKSKPNYRDAVGQKDLLLQWLL
jgi:hypothetical protein